MPKALSPPTGYATGTFSSRKIERLTHENVAVRYLCADRHPDHDSICEFRRGNRALLESGFHQVLECAARAQVLQVGDITVALDGTKVLASASRFDKLPFDFAQGLSLSNGKALSLRVP